MSRIDRIWLYRFYSWCWLALGPIEGREDRMKRADDKAWQPELFR